MRLLWGFPDGSAGKESACNAGDLASIPGLGRSPGEGNGNTLQYSHLENPRDRGAWRAIVQGSQRAGQDGATDAHYVSVMVKEKAVGPSPQTQENRVGNYLQDRGVVHPGKVSDPSPDECLCSVNCIALRLPAGRSLPGPEACPLRCP